MQQASISVYNAIRDSYETTWSGHTDIVNAVEVCHTQTHNSHVIVDAV